MIACGDSHVLSRSNVLAGLLGAMVIIFSRCGLADIIITPELYSRFIVDDNVKLATNGKKNANSIEIAPQFKVHHRTEKTEMYLKAIFKMKRFDRNKRLNSNGQKANFYGNHRFEKNIFQWNVELDNSSILSTEREATGLIETTEQRRRWQLQPQWSKQLSERTQMSVLYGWLQTDYQGRESKRLLDYTFQEIGSSLSYILSEKQKINGLLYASRYRVDESQLTTRAMGLSMGLDRRMSEKSELALSAGTRLYENVQTFNRSFRRIKLSEQSYALIFKVGWKMSLYRGQLATVYMRSLIPSGVGSMMQEDQLSLSAKYQLKEKNRFTFAFKVLRQERLNDIDNDRFLFSMSAAYIYQVKKNLLTSIGYQLTGQRFQSVTKFGISNRLVIDIKYTWGALKLDYF